MAGRENTPDMPTVSAGERFAGIAGDWELAALMRIGRPLAEVAEPYYDEAYADGTAWRADVLVPAAMMLRHDATPAFQAVEQPEVIVAMPVAAHQEQYTIVKALEQYHRQREAPPHQIVLFCNWPAGVGEAASDATIRNIHRYMDDHPDVPIGMFSAELDCQVTIGALRRLLWDTALFTVQLSKRTDDIIMLNHDADLTYLSPTHLRDMHRALRWSPGQSLTTMAHPRHRHERNPAVLPNMDIVNAWFDLRNQLARSYYEMGVGLSARAYMAAGGFDEEKREGEMLDLVARIHEGQHLGHAGQRRVRSAQLSSSARRLYHSLADDRTIYDLWRGDFSVNDPYRSELPHQLTDIDAETRDSYIAALAIEGTRSIFQVFVERSRTLAGTPDQPDYMHWARALRMLRVTQRILGGSVAMIEEGDVTEIVRAEAAERGEYW